MVTNGFDTQGQHEPEEPPDLELSASEWLRDLDRTRETAQPISTHRVDLWGPIAVTGLAPNLEQRNEIIQSAIRDALRRTRPVGFDTKIRFGGRYSPHRREDIHPSEIGLRSAMAISRAVTVIAVIEPKAYGVYREIDDAVALDLPVIFLYPRPGSVGMPPKDLVDVHVNRRENPPQLRGISRRLRDYAKKPFHFLGYDPNHPGDIGRIFTWYWERYGQDQIKAGLAAQACADAREGVMAETFHCNRQILGLTLADAAQRINIDTRRLEAIGFYPRYLKAWDLGLVNSALDLVDCFEEFMPRNRQLPLFDDTPAFLEPMPLPTLYSIRDSHDRFNTASASLTLTFRQRERLWSNVRRRDPTPVIYMSNHRQRVLREGPRGNELSLFGESQGVYSATRMPKSELGWLNEWKRMNHA